MNAYKQMCAIEICYESLKSQAVKSVGMSAKRDSRGSHKSPAVYCLFGAHTSDGLQESHG